MSELKFDITSAQISGEDIAAGATIDGSRQVILFGASALQECWIQCPPVGDYLSSPQMQINWQMATGIAVGNIEIGVRVKAVGADENITTKSFDTVNLSGAVAVPGTERTKKITTITLTNNDSIAITDDLRFLIYRNIGGGRDNAAGNLEIISAKFLYS